MTATREECQRCGRKVPPRRAGTGYCSDKCEREQRAADEGSMQDELAHVAEATGRETEGGREMFDHDPGLTVEVRAMDVTPLDAALASHDRWNLPEGTMVCVNAGIFLGLVGHVHGYGDPVRNVTVRQGTPEEWEGR